uniref:Uncharacterized protein n=1 Tax=Arundo donax TaxID=35708 RepID=A0A0A9CMW3_ARUDO
MDVLWSIFWISFTLLLSNCTLWITFSLKLCFYGQCGSFFI